MIGLVRFIIGDKVGYSAPARYAERPSLPLAADALPYNKQEGVDYSTPSCLTFWVEDGIRTAIAVEPIPYSADAVEQ